jgi:hypothetical protein
VLTSPLLYNLTASFSIMASRGRSKGTKGRGLRARGYAPDETLPTFRLVNRYTKRYAYNSTAATTVGIFGNKLSNLMVAVTNGSTSAVPLFSTSRLLKVEIVDTNGGDIYVNWQSPTGATVPTNPDTVTFASGNAAHPSHLIAKPPAEGAASMWWSQASGAVSDICILGVTTNVTVYITVEHTLATGTIAPITLSANSTFTGIAFNYLDGTGGVLQPFVPSAAEAVKGQ